MVDFTRMWREFKADIMREVDTKLRRAGIVGQTINGAHMPAGSLPAHTHAHADTTGQTANDHHDKSHAHDGADGSGTVDHSDTTGQTANDHHNQAHDLFGTDHGDVDTATPPTDGQVLAWDDTAETWKPATPSAGAALTVEEADGTPSVSDVDTIIVSNGKLTDNGDGSVTLDLSGDAGSPDASTVTYSPAVATDWDSDTDPGNVDDALDQLAERVDDLEAGGGGGSITVEEADGTPSVSGVTKIKVPPYCLTDEGSGVVSIRFTSTERLWLDADLGITKDVSDYVNSWTDQSGYELVLSQTGTARPLWVDNQVNGCPLVRFDGSNDYMQVVFPKIAPVTFAMVATPQGTSARILLSAAAVNNDTGSWFALCRQDASYVRLYMDGGYRFSNVACATGAWHVYIVTYDGTTWTLYVDGGAGSTYTGGQSGNSGNLFLGIGYGGACQCDWAELHVVGKCLSSGDAGTLATTLKTKYGIA